MNNNHYLDLDQINMENLEKDDSYRRTGLILDTYTIIRGTLRENMHLNIFCFCPSGIVFDNVIFAGGTISLKNKKILFVKFENFICKKKSYVDIAANRYEILRDRKEEQEIWDRKHPMLSSRKILPERTCDVVITNASYCFSNSIDEFTYVLSELKKELYAKDLKSAQIEYSQIINQTKEQEKKNKVKVYGKI